MTFTEAVTALPGSVEVYGPDGERVDSGTPSISSDSTTVDVGIDPGGQGTYTVSWRVTSDDGHTISGSWVFHVGQQSGAVTLDDDAGDRAAEVVAWFARVLFSAGIIGVVGVGAVAGTGLAGWRSITVPRAEARRVWIAAGAAAVTGAALGAHRRGRRRHRLEPLRRARVTSPTSSRGRARERSMRSSSQPAW